MNPPSVAFITIKLNLLPHLSTKYSTLRENPSMPSQPPIPHLLEPYFHRTTTSPFDENDEEDNEENKPLTLLTSTLGTSTTWLLLRFILAAQQRRPRLQNEGGGGRGGGEGSQQTKVVLVSWLLDEGWWRDAGRKLVSFVLFRYGVVCPCRCMSSSVALFSALKKKRGKKELLEVADGNGSPLPWSRTTCSREYSDQRRPSRPQ